MTREIVLIEDTRLVFFGLIIFAVLFFVFDLIRSPIVAYLLQSSMWNLPLDDQVVSVADHIQTKSFQALATSLALKMFPYLIMSYFIARQRVGSPLGVALSVMAVGLMFTSVPGDFRQWPHYLSIAIDAVLATGTTLLGCRLGLLVNRRFERKI